MGRADGTRAGRRARALAVAAVVGLIPAAARAADEHPPQVLPGDAHVALVADLDADGANELVRIVATRERGHTVESWRYEGEAWMRDGDVVIPGLDASASDGRLSVGTDASSLLVWNASGRARVLVFARSGWRATSPDGLPCCLDAHELIADAGGLALEHAPMEGDLGDFIQAADMDGDGTDELIRATASLQGDEGTLEVLRWDGAAFRRLISVEGEGPIWGVMTGQTDDVAGSDVLIGPSPEGDVQRIAWADGGIVIDAAHLDLGERSEGGSITAVVDGALVLALPDGLRILRWPRGEEPITVARRDGLVYPYPGVIGSGSTTLLAIRETYFGPGIPPSPVVLYDLALERVGSVPPSPTATALSDVVSTQMAPSRGLARYPYPYIGPFPRARPDDPARFVWSGLLIEDGPSGSFEAEPISPLAGVQPIGLAGPNDAWVALGGGYLFAGRIAYLFGGGEVPEGLGAISMAWADDLIGSGSAGTTVALMDAVVVGERASGATELIAGPEGFQVVVEAPAGSWVTAWNGRQAVELTATQPSTTLTIEAPRRPEGENTRVRASLLVVTPDGRADTYEWTGTFIRQPPELSVAATTDPFQLSSTIEGAAGPHATVSVDGRAVAVAPDGSFSTSVDALPWPHTVVVTARDRLGNETAQRIEIVGLFDYREVPWVPIIGAATVGVGAALFVRGPRRRRREAHASGDGRVEELDPLEEVSPHGR